ncbi:hypothetical protein [Acholeplasma laidlawii]|uniref:hypothetical protein n=1 Tax=Acholeplasma laidlawii TaxID=2148 RepID=UPI0021F7FA88|nr:hypothetical protein [Acholeplasma laidlawii]
MALKNKLKLDPTYEPAIIYFNEFKEEVKKSNNFEHLSKKINISLPDEKARRVGQSVAAASLVKL